MELVSYAILAFFTIFPIRPFNLEIIPFEIEGMIFFDIFLEPNVLLGLSVGVMFALQKNYLELSQSILGKVNRRFSLLYIDNKRLVITFFIILLSAPIVSFIVFFRDTPSPPNYIMGYQLIIVSLVLIYINKIPSARFRSNFILVSIISCLSVFTSFTIILAFSFLKLIGFSWKDSLLLAYTAFLLKMIVFFFFYGYYLDIALSFEGLTFFVVGFIFSLLGVFVFSNITRLNNTLLICLVYIILGIALILWL